MRFILGMVTGIVLVAGFSYLHDTKVVKVGPADPFVNWGTVFAVIHR